MTLIFSADDIVACRSHRLPGRRASASISAAVTRPSRSASIFSNIWRAARRVLGGGDRSRPCWHPSIWILSSPAEAPKARARLPAAAAIAACRDDVKRCSWLSDFRLMCVPAPAGAHGQCKPSLAAQRPGLGLETTSTCRTGRRRGPDSARGAAAERSRWRRTGVPTPPWQGSRGPRPRPRPRP